MDGGFNEAERETDTGVTREREKEKFIEEAKFRFLVHQLFSQKKSFNKSLFFKTHSHHHTHKIHTNNLSREEEEDAREANREARTLE